MRSIAFVTPGYDPRDIRRGSGTFFHLAQELERQGCKLHWVGPLLIKDPVPTRFFRMITQHFFKARYLTFLDPWVAHARCRELARQLSHTEHDLILTNDHGIAAGNVLDKPVVVYTDVMLPVDNYRKLTGQWTPVSKIPDSVVRFFRSTIERSLQQASLCIFPAEWQRKEAMKYGVVSSKVHVIPFGANITDLDPSIAKKRDFASNALNKKIDLLFVGKDWERKGGSLAVDITRSLAEIGFDVCLHVVGLSLDSPPRGVRTYGILDKNQLSEMTLLCELYKTCDILIIPSRYEGSAIAPREAAAYGMPTIGYKIDGLVGAIDDGISGVLLEVSAGEEEFVGVIVDLLENPEKYNRLARSARRFYETSANWRSTVEELLKLIGGVTK